MINSRWILLTLCALLGFLQFRLWTGEGNLREVFRLKQIIQAQTEEIERLSLRNRRLDGEVQALKTTPEALEERARSELGMIKQNEIFYVIIEPMR